MKKIIVLLTLTLLLASCSSSDSSTPVSENDTLLMKMVETYGSDPAITTNFTYNGKKLVKAEASDGSYVKFIYTGDLLTKIEYYDSSNVIVKKEIYTYNTNNQLISYLWAEIPEDYGSLETYIHNSDGTITIEKFTGSAVIQTTPSDTGTIYFLNGDVSMIDLLNEGLYSYTYDSKNSPFKNIIGLDKTNFTDGDPMGLAHNITIEEHDGFPTATINYTYTYNSQNFPSSKSWNEGSTNASIQYFYN